MSLYEELDGKKAQDIKWGLNVSPNNKMKTVIKADAVAFVETWEHYQYIKTSPDSQKVGCCDMETWLGGIASYYITKITGEVHHMAVEKAYWKALKDYYNTTNDQGLDSTDGAKFLADNKILKLTWADSTDLWNDLHETPIPIYQYATDAMMPQNLSPVIGQESDDYVQSANFLLNNYGGHARFLVGATVHNGVQIGIIRGSWGRIGYGLDCLTCGTPFYLGRTAMCPYTKPNVTDLGDNWRDWILD